MGSACKHASWQPVAGMWPPALACGPAHVRVRVPQAGITDQIFGKVLRLTAAARLARGTGGIVNLQSNDTQKAGAHPQT